MRGDADSARMQTADVTFKEVVVPCVATQFGMDRLVVGIEGG